MDSSFDFPELSIFSTGTEGPPGQRVFYLQAGTDLDVVTLRLEKQQVEALADFLEQIAVRYDMVVDEPEPMVPLESPLLTEWIVGSMLVAVDQDESRLIVIAEELLPDDADPDQPSEGAEARFVLTPAQAAGFVIGAREVVTRGRPICRLCGRPIDPDGHFCPRMN